MLRFKTPTEIEAEIRSAENIYFTKQNLGLGMERTPSDDELVANYYQHNVLPHIMEFDVEPTVSDIPVRNDPQGRLFSEGR